MASRWYPGPILPIMLCVPSSVLASQFLEPALGHRAFVPAAPSVWDVLPSPLHLGFAYLSFRCQPNAASSGEPSIATLTRSRTLFQALIPTASRTSRFCVRWRVGLVRGQLSCWTQFHELTALSAFAYCGLLVLAVVPGA